MDGINLQEDKQTCQKTSELASSSVCEADENSTDTDQSQHSIGTKKHRTLTALHVDMNDAFWQQRSDLLSGTK